MRTTRHLRGILASPRVRRLAEKQGIDLTSLRGSGPGGRLLESDLVAPSHEPKATARSVALVKVSEPEPQMLASGAGCRESMSAIEMATARRLSRSWATVPHVTLFREVDASGFEAQRRVSSQSFEKLGIKVTVTTLLAKLVARALWGHPRFNSSLDEARSEIVYRDDVNIGFATDTPRGLVVPVIANVDQKTLGALAAELAQLTNVAREGKLRLDQMRGGTFTISNLGMSHPGFFTPIVNLPEVAILGVGAVRPSGNGLVMPLSLSFDHRVLNGADAARFMQTLAGGITDPLTCLLI